MSSIDSRIVTMKFDNAAFSKGVQSTLDLLSKLKTATTGLPATAGKGLASISSAVSKTNIGSLTSQVDGVTHSFSALTVAATAGLATIAVKATEAGINVAKSLSIAPVFSGFQEYELKMGSIQTILSNTARYGTSLQEVNKALNQLNHYADKTIYNFGDMTKNVGLFTNAGLRVEEATSIIKGFSNEAAASGTNAQGAASAAYQLSQALSAGTIRLMDWRSLQNVGMGNKNMQNGLIEIADAMGMLDKAETSSTEVAGNFNASLEKNWLSADVMSNYLKIMAGDLDKAKMKQLGLTDAQIKAFGAQQQMSEDAATKVRTFTQLMSTIRESIGSTWSSIFGIIFGDFNEATKLFTGLNNAIGGFFGRWGKGMTTLLKGWDALGGRSKLLRGLYNGFKAIYKVLKPIGKAFRDVFPKSTSQGLYELTVRFRDFMKELKIAPSTMHDIKAIFHLLFSVIKIGISIVGGIIKYFATFLGLVGKGSGGVLHFVASIAKVISKITDWINETNAIGKVFDKVIAGRAKLLTPIFEGIGKIAAALGDIIQSGGILAIAKVGDALERLKPILPVIRDGLQAAGEAVQKYLLKAFDAIQPVLDNVGQSIQNALGSISGVGGKIGGALSGIKGFSLGNLFNLGGAPDAAASGIDKVNNALGSVAGTVEGKTQPALSGIWGFLKAVAGAIAGVAVLIATGVRNLAVSFNDAFSGGNAFDSGLLGGLQKILSGIWQFIVGYFDNLHWGDIILAIDTGLMAAVGAGFVKLLFSLSSVFSNFANVFKGINKIFNAAAEGITNLGKATRDEARAKVITAYAIAIGVLAASLYLLSRIDPKKLATALGAVTAVLLELTTALMVLEKTLPESGNFKQSAQLAALGTVLISLAAALLLFSIALKIISTMDGKDIAKGMVTLGLALAGIVGAITVINKAGGAAGIVRAAFAIGVLGGSLLILAIALKLYAAMKFSTIIEGLVAVVAVIAAVGIAFRAFPASGVLAASVAMAILAGALLVIAGALKIIATMSAGDSFQSIFTLVAALAALVIAANGMEGAMPGALAMVVMAAGVVAIAHALKILGGMDLWSLIKGIGGMVIALTALGVLALAGAVSGATEALILLAGAIALLGAGIFAIGAGVALFAVALTTMSVVGPAAMAVLIDSIHMFLQELPKFFQELRASVGEAAKTFREAGVKFVQAGGAILGAFLRQIIKRVPQLGRAFRTMVREALKTVRALTPDVVATGINMIIKFLAGISKNIGKITGIVGDIIAGFITALGNKIGKIIDAGIKFAIKFLKGLADGIRKNKKEFGDKMVDVGGAIIEGTVEGLKQFGGQIKDMMLDLAHDAWGAVKDFFHVGSPSKLMRDTIGRWIPLGLAEGIKDTAPHVSKEAEAMGRGALDVLSTTMSKLNDEVQLDPSMTPTITPVLDLSRIANDASKISGLLDTPALSPTYSRAQAADLTSQLEAAAAAAAEAAAAGGDVYLTQNNNSPEALDAATIYRNTRNQLSMAKEALKKS